MAADPACPRHAADLPTADDARLLGHHLLVVHKAKRRLMLYREGELQTCWPVGLGFAPEGHKAVEGDGKTPEGWYRTSDKSWSAFDNAIAIHYPNAGDARAAAADGRITKTTRDTIVRASKQRRVPPQRTAVGGAILIHGGGSSTDWTAGCVALDDDDLLDLRSRMPGTKRANLLVLP
jgi:murein L,D-transpeptidase YafK